MKELYFGELKRDAEGDFWVDDTKVDWKKVTEVQLIMHLGALLGSVIGNMRMENRVGSLLLTLNFKEEDEK